MHAMMMRLATSMAFLGGIILSVLILLTVVSIAGRSANTIGHVDSIQATVPFLADFLTTLGPIPGDFEIVEAGVAVAIMAFLPICQLRRGHASVELLTSMLPGIANRVLAFIWELVFAFVLIVITWRLFVGTTDKARYGETTFLLQFPVWWGYAACTALGVLVCIIAVYSVWLHGQELRSPDQTTTEHGSIES